MLSEYQATATGNNLQKNLQYMYFYTVARSQLHRHWHYTQLVLTAIIRFGTLPSFAKTSSRLIVSSFPTTSLRRVGRYFSTLKNMPSLASELVPYHSYSQKLSMTYWVLMITVARKTISSHKWWWIFVSKVTFKNSLSTVSSVNVTY